MNPGFFKSFQNNDLFFVPLNFSVMLTVVWLLDSYFKNQLFVSGRVSSCYSIETQSKTTIFRLKKNKSQMWWNTLLIEESHIHVVIKTIIKEKISQNDTHDSETVLLPVRLLYISCQHSMFWLFCMQLSSSWKLHHGLDPGGSREHHLWWVHCTMWQPLYTKNR